MKHKNNKNRDKGIERIGSISSIAPRVRIIDTRPDVDENKRNYLTSAEEAESMRGKVWDFVLVNESESEPVIKLVEFEKYRYQVQKNQRMQSKKAREQARPPKSVFFTIGIARHDYDVKLNQIRKFLEKGEKVLVGVKNVYSNRKSLPRGKSLNQYARSTDNFILKRVITDIEGSDVDISKMSFGDNIISASIQRVSS